jgi:hypothetical protein
LEIAQKYEKRINSLGSLIFDNRLEEIYQYSNKKREKDTGGYLSQLQASICVKRGLARTKNFLHGYI